MGLPLPLPGMGNRRRRNRKSRLSTQHQAETRSSSTEVETCVRTVQLRSSPSPARSPSVQVTRSPSVQVTSVHTRVGTSRSKADRSRSPLRGNMSRNQQRREVGRSKSRSREGELPRRRSRANSRHNRSKYDYQRPASSHLPRPRRAYRSKASSRLASSFDDMPSIVSEGPRGPAGISQPGTQGASKSQAESFSPDHSGTRAQGRGKSAVSARSPIVDPAPGSQFSVPSPSASQLGTEAEK